MPLGVGIPWKTVFLDIVSGDMYFDALIIGLC